MLHPAEKISSDEISRFQYDSTRFRLKILGSVGASNFPTNTKLKKKKKEKLTKQNSFFKKKKENKETPSSRSAIDDDSRILDPVCPRSSLRLPRVQQRQTIERECP